MGFKRLCIVIGIGLACAHVQVFAADSNKGTPYFQLEIEDVHQNLGSRGGYPPYPVFVPAARKQGPLRGEKPGAKNAQSQKTLKGSANQNAARVAVLPKQFLGTWVVRGSRTRAMGGGPQYQAAINRVMPQANNQNWMIAGRPGAYSMNSTAGASSISVEQSSADTVFIRHQCRVGNCVAYESYVLRLDANGRTFRGMMNCNVSKPGEPPPPRFQAQYALTGQR
jgi:hypothetical protein